MAEGVLFGTAGKVLQVLQSLALQEMGLAYGVKNEIRKLNDTVATINAVLLDAEEQHAKQNQVVIHWLRRLKDAIYDADDLLDDFATELKKREVMIGNKMAKEVHIFFSQSNQIAYSLKMSHKLKTIRQTLDEIANNKKFHLNERRDEKPFVNAEREETHSFVRKEKIIGRENDKNAVIQLLLDGNYVENVTVIPIIGFGGLGKTALAQFAYNDEMVKSHFQLRMWVCVSDVFNVKIIVEKIIRSATNKQLEKLDMDQLQQYLREEINGKRYLLVLDDVWNEDHQKWEDLKDLLMNGVRGSKILVTTRSENVAKLTTKLQPYVLKGLSKDESWSLFLQISFDNGVEPKSSRLVEIGKEMVAKCAGVPLAIKTLGNLLCNNNTEDGWLYLRDNELSKIDQGESGILPILKLSYYHLPSHLKQCFAYCAMFPKDYNIERHKLINLWMAEGFLASSNNNQCPEDVGSKYFKDLLSRSFFQDAEYDEWGYVTTCKMHDLMHDIAQQVVGANCIMTNLDAKSVDERCRHVSFGSTSDLSWKFPNALTKAKHIRTFLSPIQLYFFQGSFIKLDYKFCKTLLKNFKCLRVLDLSRLDIRKLPNLFNKLKHLRYLDLSWNSFRKLPNSISKLRNLETLNLSYCYRLRGLPRDIEKMVSIRHLIIDGCKDFAKMPYGLRSLSSLQTLSVFVVQYNEKGAFEKLNRLNNLRGELQIKILGNCKEDASSANLEAKSHLLSLLLDLGYVLWEGRNDEVLLEGLKPHPNLKKISIKSFEGVRISNWLSSLTNLTSIHISISFDCQHIPPLDELPSLKSLFLEDLYNLEYVSDKGCNACSSALQMSTFFSSLQELSLLNCFALKGWLRIDDGELPSFPCLSKLKICHCPTLTSMPLFPSLEELELLKTSSKSLLQTMMLMTPSTFSCISEPLSKLKSLSIERIEDLKCLSKGLQNFTSLQNMTIRDCENFTNDDDDMQWQGLRSLSSLKFCELPKLGSLPKGLQYVTTLQHLAIAHCPDFKVLPTWICNLTSLADLKIWDCCKLTSLPAGMQLQQLSIIHCPLLIERYGNNEGVDWPKIAHIPNILIHSEFIQKEGRY